MPSSTGLAKVICGGAEEGREIYLLTGEIIPDRLQGLGVGDREEVGACLGEAAMGCLTR